MIQINKVILLTLLVSIFSCSEEEENLNPVDNGSINDVVGTWQKIGEYDENGQLEDQGTPWTICNLQSYFVLQNDGNAVMTTFFLENEIDGDCISLNETFQFNYINTTTLEFEVPSACGYHTITLLGNNQLKWNYCNADTQTIRQGYMLWEKQ